MITYTWRIAGVKTDALYGDELEDFVSSVQYQYWGTDETGDKAYLEEWVSLNPSEGQGYTARADLTDEIVTGWVQQAVPQEKIDSMQQEISDMLVMCRNTKMSS